MQLENWRHAGLWVLLSGACCAIAALSIAVVKEGRAHISITIERAMSILRTEKDPELRAAALVRLQDHLLEVVALLQEQAANGDQQALAMLEHLKTRFK